MGAFFFFLVCNPQTTFFLNTKDEQRSTFPSFNQSSLVYLFIETSIHSQLNGWVVTQLFIVPLPLPSPSLLTHSPILVGIFQRNCIVETLLALGMTLGAKYYIIVRILEFLKPNFLVIRCFWCYESITNSLSISIFLEKKPHCSL